MQNTTNTSTWLESRPGYIKGGSCRTDLPEGAVFLHSSEEEYVPETGQTYVYETWECGMVPTGTAPNGQTLYRWVEEDGREYEEYWQVVPGGGLVQYRQI